MIFLVKEPLMKSEKPVRFHISAGYFMIVTALPWIAFVFFALAHCHSNPFDSGFRQEFASEFFVMQPIGRLFCALGSLLVPVLSIWSLKFIFGEPFIAIFDERGIQLIFIWGRRNIKWEDMPSFDVRLFAPEIAGSAVLAIITTCSGYNVTLRLSQGSKIEELHTMGSSQKTDYKVR
jgi:hypothetical protein